MERPLGDYITWPQAVIHACMSYCLYLDSVQTGSTALLVAALQGHLRVVEMLLEANADVNIKKNVRLALCTAHVQYCL